MYKQFYAGMAFEFLPLFALVLFMAVFVGTAVRLFLRRSSDYDPLATLPLSGPPESTTLLTSAKPAAPAASTEETNHG